MDLTSYLLGKKAGGGTPPVLENKEVTITSNGETKITPSTGYDGINSVEVTTSVPQPSGKIQITQTGTDIDVSSYATADVSVPSQKFGFVSGGNIYFPVKTQAEMEAEITNLKNNINMSTLTGLTFSGQNQITSLDLSGLNTSGFTAMNNMFYNCSNLQTLNLTGFSTNSATNMSSMFNNCSSLTSLDLSNCDVSNVTTISYMFQDCKSLTFLDIRTMDGTLIGSSTNPFGYANSGGNHYMKTDCLMIVKDDNAKATIRSKYSASTFTNIKTVAEYEGS